MLTTTSGCELSLERGPGWLFVKLGSLDPDSPEAFALADRIWDLLESHTVYRLVLELDEIEVLQTLLIAQLVRLHRWISQHDGVIHLAGLSAHNREVLRTCRLDNRLPSFADRVEAVMGYHPTQPR